MKISQKLVSTVGAAILGLGMTAGVAFAADPNAQSQMDLSLNVTCQQVADVTVSGNGSFAPIDIAGGNYSTSTSSNAITVGVDVGCYYGGWRVDAEMSRFRSGSDSFSANKFSLEAGPVSSFFDGNFLGAPLFEPLPPHSHDSTFGGGDADEIFHTTNLVWGDPQITENPAPYTSTAKFTGHLDNLYGVEPGEYISTLTTILTLED